MTRIVLTIKSAFYLFEKISLVEQAVVNLKLAE